MEVTSVFQQSSHACLGTSRKTHVMHVTHATVRKTLLESRLCRCAPHCASVSFFETCGLLPLVVCRPRVRLHSAPPLRGFAARLLAPDPHSVLNPVQTDKRCSATVHWCRGSRKHYLTGTVDPFEMLWPLWSFQVCMLFIRIGSGGGKPQAHNLGLAGPCGSAVCLPGSTALAVKRSTVIYRCTCTW